MTDSEADSTEFPYSRTIEHGTREQCVYCGIVFGTRGKEHSIGAGVHYTYGPVVDKHGTEYECVSASPPGSYLLHDDCYKEWRAEVHREENTQLTDFQA